MKPIKPWSEADAAENAALELARLLPRPVPPSPAVELEFAEALARNAFPAPAGPLAGLSVGAKAAIVAVTGALVGVGVAIFLHSTEPAPLQEQPLPKGSSQSNAVEAALGERAAAPEVAPQMVTPGQASDSQRETTVQEADAKPVAAIPPRGHLSPVDLLRMEEELLENARKNLGGNPGAALALLRRHQANFPRGQLVAERLFMMTSALGALGDKFGAENARAELLRRFPRSGYAARLQADMNNQTSKEK